MKDTLEIINRMQSDGVIKKYAIGGAVGATLYLEPSATLDVDVFVMLPSASVGSLVSLTGIYSYLTALGCEPQGEHIMIGSWPVQFLTPGTPLENEAIAEARLTDVAGVSTWVMSAEHLVAIALQTGRRKDHARILQFLEQKALDDAKLQQLLARHGLLEKWQKFRERWLDE
jgi:hypothetical protein